MVVRPAIDRVLDEIDDAGELLRYAGNSDNPPEARLLAGAKLLALFELSAEARWTRPPGVTRETVLATIAGLNSVRWRDPYWTGQSRAFASRVTGSGWSEKPQQVPLA